MEKKSIFRQESLDRVASPEQLNDYIHVSSPSVWLTLGAFFILAISVIVWGFTDTIPKTMSANGVVENGNVICYIGVDKLDSDITGCRAKITPSDFSSSEIPVSGTVVKVSKTPYSAQEINNTLKNDWIESNLVDSKYSYAVTICVNDRSLHIESGKIAAVSLTIAELKPIDFIFN